MLPTRRVVQPPGILRVAPDGKKPLIAFSKQFGLRNEYFKDMLEGRKPECTGRDGKWEAYNVCDHNSDEWVDNPRG